MLYGLVGWHAAIILLVLFVVMARFLHLTEVTEVVDMVSQRLPTRRGR